MRHVSYPPSTIRKVQRCSRALFPIDFQLTRYSQGGPTSPTSSWRFSPQPFQSGRSRKPSSTPMYGYPVSLPVTTFSHNIIAAHIVYMAIGTCCSCISPAIRRCYVVIKVQKNNFEQIDNLFLSAKLISKMFFHRFALPSHAIKNRDTSPMKRK